MWQPPIVAKITDFGLSLRLGEGQTHASNNFQAPEVLVSGHLSKAADVYSYGIVLLELACGWEAATAVMNGRAAILAATAAALEASMPGSSLSGLSDVGARSQAVYESLMPTACSDPLRQLISSCLEPAPAQRPSFEQAVSSLAAILAAEHVRLRNRTTGI
ncbi:Megakaryocyte-associated tyrosine-protein kinase [Tetrabaena socialis]|uniref:Megakaryocyte-associated tyrosine-protein kinase n=1 Tax=Tetrabaena socialis TaxID=47790 RepID=A0A2J7ZMW9_9CHLO|nr:Megakaryocyte-associated tyrosine-protein kinase [Tetrabaena socialis]|eukprot:PNH01600.1 Megakaryocyte-associated tyrosine-protein kinase [Tetrabaena socialis]